MRLPSTYSRSAALFALLALTTVLAGCSVLGGGADLPTGEQAAAKLDSLEAIEGTRVVRMNGTDGPNRTVSHVVRDIGTGKSRTVVRSGAAEGLVTVSNGSTIWLYNRSSGTVRVMHVNVSRNATAQFDTVETIFARLHAQGDESTPADISQLPVVPAPGAPGGSGPTTGSLPVYGNVSLTYNGTATVAGHKTFVVHIDSLGNESMIVSSTMWFDAEWYYPLKSRVVMSVGGERRVVTSAFRNVTFNPDVPAGTFDFDPPANATVVEHNYSSQSYESRASVEAAAEMRVPDPSVPEGFRFDSASVTTYRGNRSVTVQYTNGSATLFVMKRPATDGRSGGSDGERVDVAGHTGHLSSVAGDRLLTWTCGEWRYSVMGPLSRERIVAVAESMACE
ncbi:MAG: outer membrane lipoprotein carrier protein LolA [Haloarculaceae archaeon]